MFEIGSMLMNTAFWFMKHAVAIAVREKVEMEDAKEVHSCLRKAAGLLQFIQVLYFYINGTEGKNISNFRAKESLGRKLLGEGWRIRIIFINFFYSETLNNEYIERIHQMSYFSLSDIGMLQIFSFLIKWLYGTL